MNSDSDDTLTVSTAAATERVRSLWLVFGSLPTEDRAALVASTIAQAADPETTFANLLVARRGRQIIAAAWIQAVPGRAAVVWPPELIEGEPENTAVALFHEVEARFTSGDFDLAQAIQPLETGAVPDRLRRHGFQKAARLLILSCDMIPTGDSETGAVDNAVNDGEDNAVDRGRGQRVEPEQAGHIELEFERFEESQVERLQELIERTYVDTQDIPLLNGLRSMTDVVDGYRHVGRHDPKNWFFVKTDRSDVGCLLLTDHPSQEQFELIYMGIIPEARGQGFGQRLTERAKQETLAAGRSRLILGVDADNGPALLSYTSAGFFMLQERCVFLRSLRN